MCIRDSFYYDKRIKVDYDYFSLLRSDPRLIYICVLPRLRWGEHNIFLLVFHTWQSNFPSELKTVMVQIFKDSIMKYVWICALFRSNRSSVLDIVAVPLHMVQRFFWKVFSTWWEKRCLFNLHICHYAKQMTHQRQYLSGEREWAVTIC